MQCWTPFQGIPALLITARPFFSKTSWGKTTDSTRRESLRRLRELYALDEATPIFGLLRKLYAIDSESLPLQAIQVAWARDPLLRATTPPITDAADGQRVETASLAQAFEAAFPGQYSELSRNQTARHAASSWTQSGHLSGRAKKTRQRIKPTVVAVTMALFLGQIAGYHGAAVFSQSLVPPTGPGPRPRQGNGLRGPSCWTPQPAGSQRSH